MRQLLFVLFSLAALPAHSSPLSVLDQSFVGAPGYLWPGKTAGFTFTVGRSGILSRIEIPIRAGWMDPDPVFVEFKLLELVGYRPTTDAKVLAAATVQLPTDGDRWRIFEWTALDNISHPVTVGDRFAFIAERNWPSGFEWSGVSSYPHDGGVAWYYNGFDPDYFTLPDALGLSFRTFVSPIPEPSTPAMAGPALLSLAALRRRK